MTKLFLNLSVLAFLLTLSACAFDENRKIERLLVKSVSRIHQQFNEERFQEIYAEADEELKKQVKEEDFVAQLRQVHQEVGKLEGPEFVSIEDKLWDGLKRTAGFKRLKFPYTNLTGNKEFLVREKFAWVIKDEQAKLTFYEIKQVCRKPCDFVLELV